MVLLNVSEGRTGLLWEILGDKESPGKEELKCVSFIEQKYVV